MRQLSVSDNLIGKQSVTERENFSIFIVWAFVKHQRPILLNLAECKEKNEGVPNVLVCHD